MQTKSHQLLREYDNIFADKLGTITAIRAKLTVSPATMRRFHRYRTVSHALRPFMEQELVYLEGAGVLQHADHSEWAAPIVMVLKRDIQIRI